VVLIVPENPAVFNSLAEEIETVDNANSTNKKNFVM
jgi:hypothetical protein